MGLSIGATHAVNDGASTAIAFAVIAAVAGLATAAAFAWGLGERGPRIVGTLPAHSCLGRYRPRCCMLG